MTGLSIGIGLGLGNSGGGAAFDPASLTPTAWYDPSDISTLFQDSAGTVPVTASGDPVGRMNDKSGNGNHLTQATAAARPLYTVAGALKYLACDGVDDHLLSAAWSLPQPFSYAMGVQIPAVLGGSDKQLFRGSGDLAVPFLNSGNTYKLTSFAGTSVSTNIAPTVGTPFVANSVFNGVSSIAAFNATEVAGDQGSQALLTAHTLAVGAGYTASAVVAFVPGYIYGLVLCATALDATQRANLRTWMGAKAGIVI